MSESEWWVYMALIVSASAGFGCCLGFAGGRRSMINEIYGRRRRSVFRRAQARLQRAISTAADVLNAEVIE